MAMPNPPVPIYMIFSGGLALQGAYIRHFL